LFWLPGVPGPPGWAPPVAPRCPVGVPAGGVFLLPPSGPLSPGAWLGLPCLLAWGCPPPLPPPAPPFFVACCRSGL